MESYDYKFDFLFSNRPVLDAFGNNKNVTGIKSHVLVSEIDSEPPFLNQK